MNLRVLGENLQQTLALCGAPRGGAPCGWSWGVSAPARGPRGGSPQAAGKPCAWRSQNSAWGALKGAPSPCCRGVPGQSPLPAPRFLQGRRGEPPGTGLLLPGAGLWAGHDAIDVLPRVLSCLGLVSKLDTAPWILGCLVGAWTVPLQGPCVGSPPTPSTPVQVVGSRVLLTLRIRKLRLGRAGPCSRSPVSKGWSGGLSPGSLTPGFHHAACGGHSLCPSVERLKGAAFSQLRGVGPGTPPGPSGPVVSGADPSQVQGLPWRGAPGPSQPATTVCQ